MYKILKRRQLNEAVVYLKIEAPFVARAALPGQFVIIRVNDEGERVPFTISGANREEGSIEIIFQIVGATTKLLSVLKEGDCLADAVGPLGNPTKIEGLKKVAVVGGGVGCAIALPISRALHAQGSTVHSIVGFRNRDIVILEDEFKEASDKLVLMTDDGSYGKPGMVTAGLEELILAGEKYDEVICIGPVIMMKFVSALTAKYGIKTVVSMNSIMIDGTGMCGCCRIKVGGETKFACVDGPDFDGHQVDYDDAMSRANIYGEFEHTAYETTCNLLAKAGN